MHLGQRTVQPETLLNYGLANYCPPVVFMSHCDGPRSDERYCEAKSKKERDEKIDNGRTAQFQQSCGDTENRTVQDQEISSTIPSQPNLKSIFFKSDFIEVEQFIRGKRLRHISGSQQG